MKLHLAHIVVVSAVVVSPHAFGQSLLTQAYVVRLLGGVRTITNSLNLAIGIAPRITSVTPPTLLFENLLLGTHDTDHTFTIGPGDDPHFAAFVTYLTDGQVSYCSDWVTLGPGGSGESGIPESQFFAGLPPGNNGVDLGGFEIDYFTLRFDTLNIVSPGSNPNRDGIWTDYSFNATFSVYGQPIPEPTTLALLCLGSAAFIAEARRLTNDPQSAQYIKGVRP